MFEEYKKQRGQYQEDLKRKQQIVAEMLYKSKIQDIVDKENLMYEKAVDQYIKCIPIMGDNYINRFQNYVFDIIKENKYFDLATDEEKNNYYFRTISYNFDKSDGIQLERFFSSYCIDEIYFYITRAKLSKDKFLDLDAFLKDKKIKVIPCSDGLYSLKYAILDKTGNVISSNVNSQGWRI